MTALKLRNKLFNRHTKFFFDKAATRQTLVCSQGSPVVASRRLQDSLNTGSGANSLMSQAVFLQNSKGYVSWLDVSIGEKVSGFQTHRGRLGVMTQNPANAILHLAHSRGIIVCIYSRNRA